MTVYKFEYIYLDNCEYKIGNFSIPFNLDWPSNAIDPVTGKFTQWRHLNKYFDKIKLPGFPSNTCKVKWSYIDDYDNSKKLNCLRVNWITNFGYEYVGAEKHGCVEISFKGRILKMYTHVTTSLDFIEILNKYKDLNNVVDLIHDNVEKSILYDIVFESLGISQIVNILEK